uniref:Uncharacterized protein n=1 Tax=Anguilla anguilla TaxID=7936 RepID=A0A0E9URG5_ANGAN
MKSQLNHKFISNTSHQPNLSYVTSQPAKLIATTTVNTHL